MWSAKLFNCIDLGFQNCINFFAFCAHGSDHFTLLSLISSKIIIYFRMLYMFLSFLLRFICFHSIRQLMLHIFYTFLMLPIKCFNPLALPVFPLVGVQHMFSCIWKIHFVKWSIRFLLLFPASIHCAYAITIFFYRYILWCITLTLYFIWKLLAMEHLLE